MTYSGKEWGERIEQNTYAYMEILDFLKMEKCIWGRQKHFLNKFLLFGRLCSWKKRWLRPQLLTWLSRPSLPPLSLLPSLSQSYPRGRGRLSSSFLPAPALSCTCRSPLLFFNPQVSIQSHPKAENWKLLAWWWASGLAADLLEVEDPLACKWFLSVGQERGMYLNRLLWARVSPGTFRKMLSYWVLLWR